jgi:hypothetical protein
MDALPLTVGLFLLVASIVDLLWTSLWVDGGAGPISSHLSALLWRGLRRVGGRRSRLLSLAGPLILTVTLVTWVALLWAGWVFAFSAADASLVDPHSGDSTDLIGRFYFVGYAMFTMGNGDFSPQGSLWQIAAALTTATGMLVVTMAISYVLSVLSAVSRKRTLASSISGLGRKVEDILQAGFDGEGFHWLDQPLSDFAADINLLAEQHKSYPILHYYHSEHPQDASAVSVALLDEALAVLRYAVPAERRANGAVIASARSSVRNYIDTLEDAFIEPVEHPPAAADLARLEAAGLPTTDADSFAAALDDLSERRCHLHGMVEADAWTWPVDAD